MIKKKNFTTKIIHNDIKEKLATLAEKAELRTDQDNILTPPAFQSYYLRGNVILRIMAHKTIYFFSHSLDILQQF